jgi:hypothetical protein
VKTLVRGESAVAFEAALQDTRTSLDSVKKGLKINSDFLHHALETQQV